MKISTRGTRKNHPFGISERRPKCLCHRVVVATQADEPPIEPPSSRDLWHEPRQSSQSQRSAELYSDSPGLCQKSDGNGEGTCPCHSTRSCPPGLAPRSCVLCQRATPPQGKTLHEKPAVPLCTWLSNGMSSDAVKSPLNGNKAVQMNCVRWVESYRVSHDTIREFPSLEVGHLALLISSTVACRRFWHDRHFTLKAKDVMLVISSKQFSEFQTIQS